MLVEDMEGLPGDGHLLQAENSQALFIEPRRTQQEYPIPAAFAAYTEYLSIKLGQDKYREM